MVDGPDVPLTIFCTIALMMRGKRDAEAWRWLRRAVGRVAKSVRPEKIILFGSRAWGRPRRHSDFDVLVILDRPSNKHRRYELVDEAIGDHLWPVDLLVRRSKELESRLKIGDSFFIDIMRRGKVLYES